jgi:hypothetical protein
VLRHVHQLPGKIPCIQAYWFGGDVGVQAGNADFALVADFSDHPD